MQTYPGQDVHTPLIEPSATEPYYTMSVWYVENADVPRSDVTNTPITPAN